MIENSRNAETELQKNPNSVLNDFKQELLKLGFQFETLNQAVSFMPKHKKILLPLVIKYYSLAQIDSEKWYFASFMHHKGFDKCVPMLLDDFFADPPPFDRWKIAEIIESIRSKSYIEDYLKIISNPTYGTARQMIVLLVGKLKVEEAIPILKKLLDDVDVQGHAIIALGYMRKKELTPCFLRFSECKNSFLRKSALSALKKLS